MWTDSSLNIIFIQSSTVHDCFSSAHCNLLFFCLGVSDELHLAFFSGFKSHFLQPASCSSVTNIDSCFCALRCFYFKAQMLELFFRGFPWSTYMFPFQDLSILFLLAKNFTGNIFCHIIIIIFTQWKKLHEDRPSVWQFHSRLLARVCTLTSLSSSTGFITGSVTLHTKRVLFDDMSGNFSHRLSLLYNVALNRNHTINLFNKLLLRFSSIISTK